MTNKTISSEVFIIAVRFIPALVGTKRPY